MAKLRCKESSHFSNQLNITENFSLNIDVIYQYIDSFIEQKGMNARRAFSAVLLLLLLLYIIHYCYWNNILDAKQKKKKNDHRAHISMLSG